jgi:hypothetical protein
MKLIIHLHLVPKSRIRQCYLRVPIRLPKRHRSKRLESPVPSMEMIRNFLFVATALSQFRVGRSLYFCKTSIWMALCLRLGVYWILTSPYVYEVWEWCNFISIKKFHNIKTRNIPIKGKGRNACNDAVTQHDISVDPAYSEGEVHFLLRAAKSSLFVVSVIHDR